MKAGPASCLAILVAVLSCRGAEPVAHWPMEEGRGTKTIERIGGDAWLFRGDRTPGAILLPTWETRDTASVPGGSRAALRFSSDGLKQTSDAHVALATGFRGITGDRARTVALWIKADAVQPGIGVLVSWGLNQAGQRFTVRIDKETGALRVEFQQSWLTATTRLSDGHWHHVAVVHPAGGAAWDARLYVDGRLEKPADYFRGGKNLPVNTTDDGSNLCGLHLGTVAHARTTYGYAGLMDEVRIYDRALSTKEILGLAGGTPVGSATLARR